MRLSSPISPCCLNASVCSAIYHESAIILKRGTPLALLILNKGSDHKHFCKTVLLVGFVSGEKIKEGSISLHSFCVKRTIIVVI